MEGLSESSLLTAGAKISRVCHRIGVLLALLFLVPASAGFVVGVWDILDNVAPPGFELEIDRPGEPVAQPSGLPPLPPGFELEPADEPQHAEAFDPVAAGAIPLDEPTPAPPPGRKWVTDPALLEQLNAPAQTEDAAPQNPSYQMDSADAGLPESIIYAGFFAVLAAVTYAFCRAVGWVIRGAFAE